MAVTVHMPFEAAVTQMEEEAFVGSSLANGTTMLIGDLRKRNFQRQLGTTSASSWRTDLYHVAMHALSTLHHPITSRLAEPGKFESER